MTQNILSAKHFLWYYVSGIQSEGHTRNGVTLHELVQEDDDKMGFGPVIITANEVGKDGMEVVFRFVTSINNEINRGEMLCRVFDWAAREAGLLEIGDLQIFDEIMPWDKELIANLPRYDRKVRILLTRQAEPTGPIHMTLAQDFEWHELRDEPTPHKNIVYEAQVAWAT